MAEHAVAPSALEWDMADRMRKALRVADISSNEMADYMGVSRNSVSSWINGRAVPRRTMLRLFAMRAGVSHKWLETGEAPSSPDGDDGAPGFVVRLEGLEPPTF
jgi:transcriptional regulator with XRE-family HTH domain